MSGNRGKLGGRAAQPKQAPAPAPSARGNSGGGGKRTGADSDDAALPSQEKAKRGGDDARAEALAEARGLSEAVADNSGNYVTPPPSHPHSTTGSERAKTLELIQAKDAAAKATIELERLKAQLEREKKKTAALHAAPPPPPPPAPAPPPPPSQRKKNKVQQTVHLNVSIETGMS